MQIVNERGETIDRESQSACLARANEYDAIALRQRAAGDDDTIACYYAGWWRCKAAGAQNA